MNRKMDDDHPHQGKRKKMRTTSSSSMNRHHLLDLLPHLLDILSEQVINLFDLLPEEVIIDQILLKLPVESLFDLLPPEQTTVIINPFHLLPEEVIIDQILLKLPVESLLSLRCVSKCLRSLITSPRFVRLHTKQQLAAAHDDDDNDLILFSTCDFKEDFVFPWSRPHQKDIMLVPCAKDDECADNYLIHNYICKFSSSAATDPPRDHPEVVEKMYCPFPSTDIRASCNGLLYVHGRPICMIKSVPTDHCFSQGYVYAGKKRVTRRISPSYIWNPCTKEYKEIPPPPPSTLLKDQRVVRFDDAWSDSAICSTFSNCNSAGFCGFGYDCANDEYKILYYEHLSSKCSISSVPTTDFKVYTLGTDTWTSISDNPYKSLYFGQQWLRVGLFVNGALHWIMSSEIPSRRAAAAKIISFDIEKEVFQEIQKPPVEEDKYCYTNLQTLQGCLCVCQFPPPINRLEKVDIWMLKDYTAKDSWTKFLRVVIRRPPSSLTATAPFRYFKLLRYCRNGEIAILTNHRDLVLYNPFGSTATPVEKFKKDVMGTWHYQMNFRKSLVSLNSGTYTV